jgi:Mg-chelatase subunit ChlD
MQLVATLILLWGLPGAVSAQETGCLNQTLPISVRDGDAKPIRGLAPSDFDAKIHGGHATVLSVEPDMRPHRLVILLDTSASMAGDMLSRRWQMVINLANDAAQASGSGTQVALLLFAGQTNELYDFSKGNAPVINRLKEIASDSKFAKKQVRGHTASYDAIVKGYQLLDHPTSADVLYIITDGFDNESHTHPSEIESLLIKSMVRLFAAVLQDASTKTFHFQLAPGVRGPEDLAKLVKASGGTVLGLLETSAIDNRWMIGGADENASMHEVLDSFYRTMIENDLITIQIPSSLHGRERLQIKLPEASRKKWKDAEIFYPSEVGPCEPGPYH